ncbi:DUF6226 family protein [Desertihabitans aurantiacus]|uniref:DUF6226 family protein n=1 Tax=Desertihabitans aurantiacus TaxID=2282477 RepID=UPI000DF7DB1A|nr:DUF6226 family protein [Desertihabitans aurantiacus]
MTGYRRPALDAPELRDARGQVIPLGRRWQHLPGPPDELYSVGRYPERFEPLHQVADALVEHLQHTYRVQVAPDALRRRGPLDTEEMLRAIRLQPTTPDTSGLTVAWSRYPGLRLEWGHLGRAAYPQCGCEACDETWESAADELEEDVFALVEGRYGEHLTELDGRPATGTVVVDPAGLPVRSSRTTSDLPPRARAELGRHLARLPDGRWPAWPRRDADPTG